MNAVLIIAHAPLANALREGVLHCFPDAADSVAAVDVQARAEPEASLAQAQQALKSLPSGNVLVLTDIFGATPCNVAQRLVDGVHTRLIAGANLPMALRAMSYRAEPLEAMAARALAGGTQGVMSVAAATGPQNQSRRPSNDSEHHHHQQ
ncbi:PTS fructose transporter subunit IIA [Ottowia sp. GY511]|uniref:PTS sugar transporter subunit IIA n=1 Tax=Ottowia flava TaxID=2675430 RepID=A0ABW4L1X6_9BURK|nr:PTS fructose transporter subunit IIA [Ottowia sp. GY511]TXK27367.1 PTS fructose transporter subunit IIA [Ottowia sp. GY511]